MSYATMDRAGWVQSNINAHRRNAKKRRADLIKGWDAAPEKLAPFQEKVFDILGMTFGGIYNAPIAWNALGWKGWGAGIFVPLTHRASLVTFDYVNLTRLVFLCHEARIRCEIMPHQFNLGLAFFPRKADGGMGARHPNLDEAVAEFRGYIPKDHRIFFREAAPAEECEA